MTHEMAKPFFNSAVQHVTDSIHEYAANPLKDFTRSRKLPPDMLVNFLACQGSSCTKNELAGFFGLDAPMPTESALARQRAKLKPEAPEAQNLPLSMAPHLHFLASSDFRWKASLWAKETGIYKCSLWKRNS